MSYWLRGGLGIFSPPAPPNFEDCIPFDTACVNRNRILGDAYEQAMVKAQADNNRDQCISNAGNANTPEAKAAALARCDAAYAGAEAYGGGSGPVNWGVPVGNAQPYTGLVAPKAAAVAGGKLTFTTSRGGTALQVGDTWLVSITGASPNSPVTVSGSGNTGAFGSTPMGSTDAAGNFSKSGTAGAGDVGSWNETWAVGGVTSGTISFTIAAALPGQPPAAVVNPPSSTSGASVLVLPTVGGFDLGSIPWWGWAGAAGAAYFMFVRKGGR